MYFLSPQPILQRGSNGLFQGTLYFLRFQELGPTFSREDPTFSRRGDVRSLIPMETYGTRVIPNVHALLANVLKL